MKKAKQFLKDKRIKDTLFDVDYAGFPPKWIKGGLSKLLDEYTAENKRNSEENIRKAIHFGAEFRATLKGYPSTQDEDNFIKHLKK